MSPPSGLSPGAYLIVAYVSLAFLLAFLVLQ
jgi:hypothetical protein